MNFDAKPRASCGRCTFGGCYAIMGVDHLKGGGIPMFDRVTIEPDKMGGQPCVRGMRVPVSLVVDLVGQGMSDAEIQEAYPYIEIDDIRQCVQFAAAVLKTESYHPFRQVG